MIGAIIGDIVGSRFEFRPIKTKNFKWFTESNFFTDDTVMTCAIAQAIIEWTNSNKTKNLEVLATKWMQKLGRKYPDAGYGNSFNKWIFSDKPKPYNSFGNGSAMRVSPCGLIANSLDEAIALATLVSNPTHNHKEGIKGAQATSACIYLAKTGKSKEEIRKYINNNFYKLDFKLDDIRPSYTFDVTCQGSVPQAIECFLESKDYIDCINNAISLGGDSDTIAAIAGSVAQVFYGVDKRIEDMALTYLDTDLLSIVSKFKSIIS